VEAAEIDAIALIAIGLNAEANHTEITALDGDIVGRISSAWDVVLAADVCYEGPASKRIVAWLDDLARTGVLVLMGDPGRTYFPKSGHEKLISYAVKTTTELEDTDLRNTSVWRVTGERDGL